MEMKCRRDLTNPFYAFAFSFSLSDVMLLKGSEMLFRLEIRIEIEKSRNPSAEHAVARKSFVDLFRYQLRIFNQFCHFYASVS